MSDDQEEKPASFSIVDLIIQEQMEKDALVLAPKPAPTEKKPQPEEVAEEEPEARNVVEEAPPQVLEEAPPAIILESPPPIIIVEDAPPEAVENAPAAEAPPAEEEPPAEDPSVEEEVDDFELTEEELAELAEWDLELTDEELAELAEFEAEETGDVLPVQPEVVGPVAEPGESETLEFVSAETSSLLLGPSADKAEDDLFELFKPLGPAETSTLATPSGADPFVEQLGASVDELEEDIFDLFKPVENFEPVVREQTSVSSPPISVPPPVVESLQKEASQPESPAPPASLEANKTRELASSTKAVGGQLRELEQRLTKTLPLTLPDEIKKRSSAAMQYLATLSGIERGVVVVEQGEELQVTAVGNLEREYLEKVPRRVLKSVLRTGEPLLILDATKDARYKQDPVMKEQGIKSALCVRFLDGVTGLQGVLYADNLERANAFTYQELRGAEWFAQRLENDPVLEEYQPKTVEPKAQEEVLQTEPTRTDPRLFVLAAVAAILLVFPALSNPTKTEPEPKSASTSAAVERVTTDPKTVVLSFLRAVETRNHRSAYNYLSSDRKSQLEEEKFGEAIRKFLVAGDNAWLLSQLSILEESRASGSSKSYKLIKPDQTLAGTISVQESEGSWYISQIKGMNELSF